MRRIWDCHSHWMPPEVAQATTFFKKGWSDIDQLLFRLDQKGVERAVLLYPSSDAHIKLGSWSGLSAVYNQEIAKVVKKYPDRLIGTGILALDNQLDMASQVKRIKDIGLEGVSLASSYQGKFLDQGCFQAVFQTAGQENLPIFVHSQIINPIGFERVKDPLLMPVVEYVFDITMSAGSLLMSGRLSQFKNFKIIFSHFAGVLPFLFDRFDSTYLMLRSRDLVKDLGGLPSAIFKNIFVDTSGVKSPAMLQLALETFGPGQILWGSDFPAKKDLSPGIKAIEDLDIEESQKENILAGNLTKIFSISH